MSKPTPSLELVPLDPPPGATGADGAPASARPALQSETLDLRKLAAADAGGAGERPAVRKGPPPVAAPRTPPRLGPEIVEIEPLDKPKPAVATAMAGADRYAKEAAREYAEGRTDPLLWQRAITQAGGDREAAAESYLRSRAAALRLLDRDRKHRPSVGAGPLAGSPGTDLLPLEANGVARAPAFQPPRNFPYAVVGIGALTVVVIGVALLLALRGPRQGNGATATPVAASPKAPGPAAAVSSPVAAASAPAPTDFARKIQELKDAGNWNVLTLHAVEWTRREPANAVAWNELRGGYLALNQRAETLEAAKKTVELAPGEAAFWRNLGHAHLGVDDAISALTAYEQAVARDPQDVASLRQIGLMHVRIGHPQEAKAALDRALAADPADAVTQCVRAGIAQLPAVQKSAYAATQEVKAVETRCGAGAPTAVAAGK